MWSPGCILEGTTVGRGRRREVTLGEELGSAGRRSRHALLSNSGALVH